MVGKRKKATRGLETIRDFENADLTAGERHLADFVKARSSGDAIPEPTLQFVKVAFQRILAGDPPADALDLNKKRGRRQIPIGIADQVARDVMLERLRGATYEEGVRVVAAQYQLSKNTVDGYYSRSKACGGVPEVVEAIPSMVTYPDNPIEREKYLGGLLKKRR